MASPGLGMLFVLCVLFGGATCSCCNNLSCRNACVHFAFASASASVFASASCLFVCFTLLPLRLCFCFCSHFCSCFLSFRRFVLLAACVVVFVLFNVIASTLVHRHGHGHEARGLRHMATPATPFLLWYVCVFYTMDKLFFNISAADAICLGRKLDKRLGSLHGFALAWLGQINFVLAHFDKLKPQSQQLDCCCCPI